MNKKTIIGLMLLSISLTFAQRKADEVTNFDSNIESISLIPLTGDVIVKDKNAISNYNPKTKATTWKIDKSKIQIDILNTTLGGIMSNFMENSSEIEILGNSSYARIVLDNNDVIINILTGDVLLNSKDFKGRILETNYVLEENALLMLTVDEKMYNLVYFDLNNKTTSWTTVLGDQQKVSALMSVINPFGKGAMEASDSILIVDNNLFVTVRGILLNLDATTGAIKWKTDYKVGNFYLSQNLNDIIIVTNSGGLFSSKVAINILDSHTGEKLWKNDISTKYISYLEDWNDRILVAHNSGFNFYSYETGKKLWKKDAKGKDIKSVIPIGSDYLYIADTEMNLVNKEGVPQWKKFIEIADNSEDQIYYLDKVDNNRVLYLTDTYGNMVDYSSGKKIWKKNIKFSKNRPLVVGHDTKENTFLVYNNKKIYKFDPNSSDAPEPIGDKIDVKNDKAISSLEVIDGVICIIGQNDAIGVAMDGNVMYHNTYQEPGETGRRLLKSGMIAANVVGGVNAARQSAIANSSYSVNYRDANGQVVSSSDYVFSEKDRAKAQRNMNTQKDMLAGLNSELGPLVNQRFNALKQSPEYAFIFAKGTDGESTQLVKVRKKDGKEVDKIAIDNKKPIYEVDPVNNNIYYVYNNELRTFNAK